MSETLGEKLRQAREARGITISEVADQTRIAPLYIESIERDDFSPLPGGIFNKGFVKSFARYVGVDEQEALQDYAKLIAGQDNQLSEEPKTRRPEVLTDDRASISNLPTIIIAILILGLMTWGVLALVRYIQSPPTEQAANTTGSTNTNVSTVSNISLPNANTATASGVSMNNLKVEIKAVKSAVSLVSVNDGDRNNSLLAVEKAKAFEPKESLRFSYSISKAKNVELTINGKQIAVPTAPATAGRSVIDFEINKDNVQKIWESGQVTYEGTPAAR